MVFTGQRHAGVGTVCHWADDPPVDVRRFHRHRHAAGHPGPLQPLQHPEHHDGPAASEQGVRPLREFQRRPQRRLHHLQGQAGRQRPGAGPELEDQRHAKQVCVFGGAADVVWPFKFTH